MGSIETWLVHGVKYRNQLRKVWPGTYAFGCPSNPWPISIAAGVAATVTNAPAGAAEAGGNAIPGVV